MINHELAAALAFTALGANVLGAVVLMLLNSGSRSLRWYMPFQAAAIVWLVGQGAHQLWPSALWESIAIFGATILPLLFLLFAIMEGPARPAWHGMLILLAAAPLVPVVMGCMYRNCGSALELVNTAWFCAGWIGGPAILWVRGLRQTRSKPATSGIGKKIALLSLLLIAPVSIVGSLLVEGPGFVFYVIPIITILVLFLIFFGVTRMQFYDIEVRVRRSGEIAATTAEMERLAVLGEVAATIAHEVRNPLTGVRSLAQRIATDDIDTEKRRKYASVILEETGRVERLVSNLLELARRSTPREEKSISTTTPLAPLFEDLMLLVAARAERARVRISAHAHDVTAPAPREALAQALMNLLLNAIAHSPPNGAVELSAGATRERVQICVRDQGPGIPAAQRDRIFDTFYTTSDTGTGLGLSVVRHLVREHGWQVTASDAAGSGTVFTIEIPCAS